MPRFFVPLSLSVGDVVDLPAEVAHHLQVLRLGPGATVTLFNGEGGEYSATVAEARKRSASAEIKAYDPREAELAHGLTLAQALPEASKMDWIIEKAVELGVTGIQPLAARRSVVKLAGERLEKRQAHWQGIIVSAAEQCGRNRLPLLAGLQDLPAWLGQRDMHKRVLLSPRGTQSLADWARHQPAQALTLLVGPEGGFSPEEEELACAQGALALTMGPRILRTETAGLAAVSALNAIWGGM